MLRPRRGFLAHCTAPMYLWDVSLVTSRSLHCPGDLNSQGMLVQSGAEGGEQLRALCNINKTGIAQHCTASYSQSAPKLLLNITNCCLSQFAKDTGEPCVLTTKKLIL